MRLTELHHDGTVIRWIDNGYTYAAVYVAAVGKWYLTGGQSFYGTSTPTPEQLLKALRRSGTRVADLVVMRPDQTITLD